MKRIVLLFTVAAMMAMMGLVMGAGPALAQTTDDNGDLDVFSIFEEEEEPTEVIVCDSDEGDVEEVDDVVVVFCDEDDDDDDFFDFDHHDDHWFGRDRWDHWR